MYLLWSSEVPTDEEERPEPRQADQPQKAAKAEIALPHQVGISLVRLGLDGIDFPGKPLAGPGLDSGSIPDSSTKHKRRGSNWKKRRAMKK